MSDLELERIETGEATAQEARSAVAALLKEGSERSLRQLYSTLAAWLWKALESGRRDQELCEWFDIFRRASVSPAVRDTPYVERLRAFYDLLDMSIAVSRVVDPSEVLRRQHVVAILGLLRRLGPRPVEKATIARKLKLQPANLSRVLHMMGNARLVERTSHGKQAHFGITREGANALARSERSLGQEKAPVRIARPIEAHREITPELVDAIFAVAAERDLVPSRGKSIPAWQSSLKRIAPAAGDSPRFPPRVMKAKQKQPYRGLQVRTYTQKPEAPRGHLPIEALHKTRTSFTEELDHVE
ncbi:hypothetical protein [Bradyrhizobium sp. CCBAU 51753]|uniref:hypothetical protein n=1 Tax=Bradyrhizobium sp. CCBAU 51753 TaxID=1325100 RepID=UPI00188D0F52|nr:hypothetical protein [Bradyrhizobium sp. CCBAU 51753]